MAVELKLVLKKAFATRWAKKQESELSIIFPCLSKKLPPLKFIQSPEILTAELKKAAAGPLSDPVIQKFSINKPLAEEFDWLIEVGFRPGVTDNVGKTAREAIELIAGRKYRHAQNQRLYFPSISDQRKNYRRPMRKKSPPVFWPTI